MKSKGLVCAGLVVGAVFLAGASERAPSERVMVFAPHPDDEALVCTGLLKRSVLKGDAVMVVIATSGDAHIRAKVAWESNYPELCDDRDGDGDFDMIDFGIVRHDESVAALGLIGVEASDIVFLGYPDFGLADLWNGATGYISPFTLKSEVPSAYSFAHRVGAPYTRNSCVADIKDLIKEFDPTLVYSPRPTESSTDHWALGMFVAQALTESYSTGRWKAHLGYLVHWEAHEPGWPHNRLAWTYPVGHPPPNLHVKLADFGFTPDEKMEVINAYKTQVNLSGPYLRGFAKTTEIFWLESLGPRGEMSELFSSPPSAGAARY